jgi:hypothetical protein
MSAWLWKPGPRGGEFLGTHPTSGACISVRECGDGEEKAWGYVIGLERGQVETVLYSDVLFDNAEAAMRAAEALFDAEGDLLDADATFRKAFGEKLRAISAWEQSPDLSKGWKADSDLED